MAALIPRKLAEYILLGPTGDRRQLQDSPILGDVWIAFASESGPQELLITPHKSRTAGEAANWIDEEIAIDRKAHKPNAKRALPEIAYLQGVVAARLHFDEVLRVIVPMTSWWNRQTDLKIYRDGREAAIKHINTVLEAVQQMVEQWSSPNPNFRPPTMPSTLDRYAALAGIVLWAHATNPNIADNDKAPARLAAAIKKDIGKIRDLLDELFLAILAWETKPKEWKKKQEDSLVYQISLNRKADLAIARSVPSVKADAATRLFQVNCEDIAWAVIDSGIDGDHQSFKDAEGKSRIQGSFDFSRYRKIVNLDNLRIFGEGGDEEDRNRILNALLHDDLKLKNKPERGDAIRMLAQLALDARDRRPIHWEFVEPFIEIATEARPAVSDHGTHVAGIIGARTPRPDSAKPLEQSEDADGMCPNIRLYDFRVLSESSEVKDTEFAIIAVLQYIRHMNARNDFMSVHGANLSLSIKHDVRNYACGRTPICDECEHLVNSGVVVVAAAGNLGYQSFTTKEGAFESYAAFSITDPGNADGVITVGSTHRFLPHTYGVSFFSSRGPTGDGRLKPDLVAPGERIRAPFRDKIWGDLDGTSMAAPHVSGAAAMLMARYPEFIGQPRKIKKILCETATDLGRERSFQGHGLLDVLRAFQSI
jgi:subtilisin family serine protease